VDRNDNLLSLNSGAGKLSACATDDSVIRSSNASKADLKTAFIAHHVWNGLFAVEYIAFITDTMDTTGTTDTMGYLFRLDATDTTGTMKYVLRQ
jgi:hypothetical protein